MQTHRQTRPFRQTIAPSRRESSLTAPQNKYRLRKAINAISVREAAGAGRELQLLRHRHDGDLSNPRNSYGFAQYARLDMQRRRRDARPS
jgi:hypothetical protein